MAGWRIMRHSDTINLAIYPAAAYRWSVTDGYIR